MTTKKLIMCQGLPASGKSTWAKSIVTESNGEVIEVNMDDIRAEMGIDHNRNGFDKTKEFYVKAERDIRITNALKAGKSVISSDLNITPTHEVTFKHMATRYGAKFEIKVFTTTVEECIRRDAARERTVGKTVINFWDDKWKRGDEL